MRADKKIRGIRNPNRAPKPNPMFRCACGFFDPDKRKVRLHEKTCK